MGAFLKGAVMKKWILFAAVVLFSTNVWALTTLGPPKADLMKGRFSLGVDYIYGKQDVQLNHGLSPAGGPKMTIDGMKVNSVGVKLGYGLMDNWEAFISTTGGSIRGSESGGISFNSSNGYSLGFGTKATFGRYYDMDWGGIFQILWASMDGKTRAGAASWSSHASLYEIQLAIGPTYQLNDKVALYGGPFFHILDGRFSAKRRTTPARISYDLDQGSYFGGYIGAAFDITENTDFCIEYQHTATADALGMSMKYKF